MTQTIEMPGRASTFPPLPGVEDVTRREFLIGAGSLLLLAPYGCGEGDSERGETRSSGGRRSFVDVTGEEVRVPVRPERIVATHDINAGAQVLALGGPLVGVASREDGFREDITRYFDLGDIADVGLVYEPNIEQIAALEPDLIVHEGFDGEVTLEADVVARLQEIAPVVGIDTFRPVAEVMSDYDALLGEAATASLEDQRREFRSLLEELRNLLGDRWNEVTASVVSLNTGTLEAWGPTALVSADILSRVGVTWVPIMERAGSEENGGYIGGISLERLPEFSADLILTQTAYEPEILDKPLYRELPAVEAGQVIELGEPDAGTHYPNYVWVAENLLKQLRELGELRTDLV